MNFTNKHRYYYDRIRINTEIPLEDLDGFINTGEFISKGLALKIEIGDAHHSVHHEGYIGRVELHQATDAAIELLQRYDLAKHSISRLEVARDRQCRNVKSTARHRRKFQDNHYLKWGNEYWDYRTTRYFGKRKGKYRGFYMICDWPKYGKFGDYFIVHAEFVIVGKAHAKHKLGIETIHDIGVAEDSFKALAGKYLVRASVNVNRVQKYFNCTGLQELPDLMEFIKFQKQGARDREYMHRVMNLICSKAMAKKMGLKKRYVKNRRTKLMLNQGLGYWVNV